MTDLEDLQQDVDALTRESMLLQEEYTINHTFTDNRFV